MHEAHGDFELTLVGNVIVFQAYGAWNRETALSFVDKVTLVAAPIVGSDWAMLSIISDWELSTPDCNPIIRQVVESGVQKGLQCEAIVNDQGVIKMEQFHLSAPTSANLRRKEFKTKQAAIAWLSSQGFPLEN